jgi:hypothetical protein
MLKIISSKRKDLTGLRFGRLNVLGYHGLSNNGKARWLVKCDCGEEKIVRGDHLGSGRTKSCGCLWKTTSPLNAKIKHGVAAQRHIQRGSK